MIYDNELIALLDAAHSRSAEPEELLQQRASFALGNGNIEADSFSRATITVIVLPPHSPSGGTSEFPVSGASRFAAEALLRQYDLIVEVIGRYLGPSAPHFILSDDMILSLQAALVYPGGPQPGYRSSEVRIATNDFEPIGPGKVLEAIEEMCAYVNKHWDDNDALELAAYVLWRLNWIHPFGDGNGRTARALSYIVLSIKLGSVLPGSPTIPEQILQFRGQYYDALAEADRRYREDHVVDVGALRTLIRTMLFRQVRALPALSPEDLAAIRDAVDRRVRSNRDQIVAKAFGEGPLEDRLWSLSDHIVLQIGPRAAITKAEAMHNTEKEPFPRLLAMSGRGGSLLVGAAQRGLVLRNRVLDASDGFALALEHNAAVTIERPRVRWVGEGGSSEGWELKGALYVVRSGRELALARAPETFDLLLARHITSLRR